MRLFVACPKSGLWIATDGNGGDRSDDVSSGQMTMVTGLVGVAPGTNEG
jgi:hypothetical protein